MSDNRRPDEVARERIARAVEQGIQRPEARDDEDRRFETRSRASDKEAGNDRWA